MSEIVYSFYEHQDYQKGVFLPGVRKTQSIAFKGNLKCHCVAIDCKDEVGLVLHFSYYIGLDWLHENEVAIHVTPKLNANKQYIDYIGMLFSCLKHSQIAEHTEDLFEIKFDKSFIEIEQKQDMLTPILVAQFLQVMKRLVRKGLKKSYYQVERNLQSRIKGKVLISQTLKHNLLKNKTLKTVCRYDEFGVNGLENRLLKYTLLFVKRYVNTFPQLAARNDFNTTIGPIFNYCLPAFEEVDGNIDIKSVKDFKPNVFYKEYSEALRLSGLILKRFSYNIKEMEEGRYKKVKTPPFWIDMAKLFELYALGKLKNVFHSSILYGIKQAKGKYGLPDFLLTSPFPKMIIDAKYKRIYQEGKYDIEDIRQLSGYGRDEGVLAKLDIPRQEMGNTVIDCLIIYPNQDCESEVITQEFHPQKTQIEGFVNFYKLPLKLPEISE